MSNISQSEADHLNSSTIRIQYYYYAALALYIYHYSLTFSQELQVIWGRRFTGVSLLLILNRYLPFVTLITMLTTGSPLPELTTHESCAQQYIWSTIAMFVLQIVTTCLLALRVYAIWGQSWKCFVSVFITGLLGVLLLLFCVYPASVYSYASLVWGCWSSILPFVVPVYYRLELASLSLTVARDVLVLILTWLRTFEIRQLAADVHVKTHLSLLLLRDGTIYFGINLIINVTNMVAFADIDNSPVGLATGLVIIEAVLQPMLLSHLMFDMREVYQSRSSTEGTSLTLGHGTTLFFIANIVGNMGAPLVEGWVDDDKQQPLPVSCDDPFMFELIKNETTEVEMMGSAPLNTPVIPESNSSPPVDDATAVDV